MENGDREIENWRPAIGRHGTVPSGQRETPTQFLRCPRFHVRRRALLVLVLLAATVCVACDKESAERRARQAAEKMKESLPDVDGKALAQKLAPEEVRQMQQGLAAVKEYQGESNGELDQVTVNALQAFQRSQGLPDDGMWSAETKRRLQEAAAKAQPTGG